jgi:murein DD-endopeptidase MepM/ murein hydrolase activator NlpD
MIGRGLARQLLALGLTVTLGLAQCDGPRAGPLADPNVVRRQATATAPAAPAAAPAATLVRPAVLLTDTPRPQPTPTAAITEEVLGSTRGITLPAEHLWLARPVVAGAESVPGVSGVSPAPWYTYGDTLGGAYRPHHGVEFANPEGTLLVAVAPATVLAAGTDLTTTYGLGNDFYGKLVVLRLDQTYAGRQIYALYGHMAEIYVEPGERVVAGDSLGTVGSTGVADGAHLHFEVRIGANRYDSTRNPALWLAPLPATGLIAGRVLDAQGRPVEGALVHIYPAGSDALLDDVLTYVGPSVHADEVLQENFALTDVPAGEYRLRVFLGADELTARATVAPGRVTLVELRAPPAATPAP